MKRLIVTSVLLVLSFNSFAQDYIKVKENFKVNSITIYKGEIFQLEKNNQFLFNKSQLKIDKTNYDSIKNINFFTDNKLLIQKIDSAHFLIDVSTINMSIDSIKIVNSETDKQIPIAKENNQINIDDSVNEFRMIIPNNPTLFFVSNEIQDIKKTGTANENTNEEPVEPKSGIPKWILYSGIIVLVGLLVFVLIFRKKIFKKKYPIYGTYRGGEFDSFARSHGLERNDLFKMNKNLKEYNKIENNKLKQNFKENLRNQELIVGYKKEPSDNDSPSIMESIQTPSVQINNTNNRELENKLDKMERSIISKIETLSSNKEADRKIEELEKKVKQQFEKENQLQNTISELNEGNSMLKNEMDKFSGKVIETEYLATYSRLLTDFLNVAATCQQVAFESYQKLTLQDAESATILGNLLLKYQINNPLKTGNWAETIKEINENKVTTNTHLIRSFKQIEQNEGKVMEFKRIIFKEVLEKYASNILILAEELSKLTKFTNKSSHIIEDCEAVFSKSLTELQGKLNVLGFEVNYIPLFQNYEAYAAHILKVNQECSLPFKKLNNIPKDSVLEIVSYGFGNEKTKIILV